MDDGKDRLLCGNDAVTAGSLYKFSEEFFESGCLDDGDEGLIRDRFSSLRFPDRSFALKVWFFATVAAVFAVLSYIVLHSQSFGYIFVQVAVVVALHAFIQSVDLYQWFILRCARRFIVTARKFDQVMNHCFRVIRERELATLGLLTKTSVIPINSVTLREEVLLQLRDLIGSYTAASAERSRDYEKHKLFSCFFTETMKEMAMGKELSDDFLALPALKDLWRLTFLLRSEYLRLLLLRFVELSTVQSLGLLLELRTFEKKMRDCKNQVTSSMQFLRIKKHDDVDGVKPSVARQQLSELEKVAVQLEFALQMLQGEDAEENREKVVCLLRDSLDGLCAKEKKKVTFKEKEESSDEDVGSYDVAARRSNVDQVFEGFSVAKEVEEAEQDYLASYTTLRERTATTRAFVFELENALEQRKKVFTDEKDEGAAVDSPAERAREEEDLSDESSNENTCASSRDCVACSTSRVASLVVNFSGQGHVTTLKPVEAVQESESLHVMEKEQLDDQLFEDEQTSEYEQPSESQQGLDEESLESSLPSTSSVGTSQQLFGSQLAEALRVRSAIPATCYADSEPDSEGEEVFCQKL